MKTYGLGCPYLISATVVLRLPGGPVIFYKNIVGDLQLLDTITMTPSVMLQILLLFYSAYVNAQLNSSFPHSYPGIPNVEYVYNSSNFQQWQKCRLLLLFCCKQRWQWDWTLADYQVNTASLPNATQCTMPSSYAGNIPVNRSGHPNNTLFFWGLESSPGSLTTGTNSSNE